MNRDLKNDLTARLQSHGFDRVGFAAAETRAGADAFREWIERGYHGSMEYLARNVERRTTPSQVREGTQTVIVLTTPYSPAKQDASEVKIAAYARGEDYHRVLESRLKSACSELTETHAGESFRYYVDTGPILEKAWAEKAGLGWIGKNTCCIDAGGGSYFFLSVILTTLDVEADEPATDLCGRCNLCIDACPTDAFVEPYVLDARRCISYLTIEERGALNPALEDKLGEWVFGCDICQDVCPWNDAPTDGDAALAPRAENQELEIDELVRLDLESFRARFPRSPVRRAKIGGLLRNLIIAIGNSRLPNARELLATLGDNEEVRQSEDLRATLDRARGRLNS